MQSNQSAAVGSSSRFAPTGKVNAVGLDRDVTAVKERIFSNNKKLQILPIVGTGGIGKTTLAQNLYHDPLIIENFDVRAWVTVSQDYSFGDIFSTLLAYMKDKVEGEISRFTKNEMALKVYQTLTGRRYLIVIDDMWSTKAWDEIKRYFPDSSYGSRIILTTRLEDVAAYAASSSPLHSMQFMNVDQSWDLLKKEALKGKDHLLDLPWMEEIGRKIAESCGGLPLAIVVVAGLLSQVSQTKDDWEGISGNINLAISADEEKYASILSLSYTHLPDHLRPCFLYMGAFPEDYEIRVSKLVKLWIAEGFVKSTGTCSLEEAAEEFLKDLVKRNLVLVTKRKLNGRIKSCGLHDLVRDLCLIKSLQENFFLCFMGSSFLPEFFENQLRISISSSDILSQIDGSTICTIICFGRGSINSFEKFGSLKILDLLNTNIPAQVFDLRDLKLLAFEYSTPIPSSISNLETLQTLICYPNDKCMVSLPDEIWKMAQLRHLISCSFHLPDPEEPTLPLENLQTLSVITNFVCSERMVEMIPNIKKLGVCYSVDKIDEDYHLENLEHFHHLEKLKLKTEGGNSFAYGLRLNPIFPESLMELTLSGWWYSWEDLNIIGSLPNLHVLKLRNYACDGTTWQTIEGEFEKLEFLLVDESNLKEWLTESSHFPKLKSLVLRRCPLLSEIPDDIGSIPTLELIEVDNDNLMESAKKIRDEEEMNGNDSIQVRYSSAFSIHQEREFSDDLWSIAGGLVDHSVSNSSEPDDILLHDVVGLDKHRDTILNYLTHERESFQKHVIAIAGMGGSGKTTLARIVYNDDLVKQYFPVRVWVTMPQDYSVERFLSKVVDQITRVSAIEREENTSIHIIGRYLDNLQYLLVIDNLWDMNIWYDVIRYIPLKVDGSRIIITTRLQEVVDAVWDSCPYCICHWMSFLDDDQSWDLFERKLFANRVCPLELQAIGKKIVKSCRGLPLSIVRVAQLLSRVPLTPKFWEKIAESDVKLEATSILSLDNLPHHLKECFLYMAGFPEDYEIRGSEIVKLWVAEGILRHPIERGTLEEEAEFYFKDLARRDLVLEIRVKADGKVKTCRLHNTVREACIREARQQKLMLPVMDYSRSPIIRRHFLPRVLEHYERISASWYDLDIKDSTRSSCTKTIICIPQNGYRPKGLVSNFTSLKVLHVLRRNDLSYWDLGEVCDHTDLTYLASNIPSSIVPPAISKLQNLQTLIIYRFEVYLPGEIWRMPQLRHLMAFSFLPLPHPEDGDPPLENLQTLSLATDLVCSQRMVVMIPNIKKLGVRYSGEKDEGGYHLDNIAQFLRLMKLKLEMSTSFGASLPVFPQSLKKLNLSGGRLPWSDMKIIGSLPFLEVLKLRNYACDGEVWETAKGEFQMLRFLLIDESNLQYWVTKSSHFPRLESLMLYRCPYLHEIPSDFGEIRFLRLIEIDDDNQPLLDCAKKIQRGSAYLKVRVKHS